MLFIVFKKKVLWFIRLQISSKTNCYLSNWKHMIEVLFSKLQLKKLQMKLPAFSCSCQNSIALASIDDWALGWDFVWRKHRRSEDSAVSRWTHQLEGLIGSIEDYHIGAACSSSWNRHYIVIEVYEFKVYCKFKHELLVNQTQSLHKALPCYFTNTYIKRF